MEKLINVFDRIGPNVAGIAAALLLVHSEQVHGRIPNTVGAGRVFLALTASSVQT